GTRSSKYPTSVITATVKGAGRRPYTMISIVCCSPRPRIINRYHKSVGVASGAVASRRVARRRSLADLVHPYGVNPRCDDYDCRDNDCNGSSSSGSRFVRHLFHIQALDSPQAANRKGALILALIVG